ncbi:MAG TPA: acyl-CoA thioesterase [Myxococcales bacterium]
MSYPVTIELPVQWGDMDSFGHVNNVMYLRWFESARIAYFERTGMMKTMPKVGPIMARQSIDYRMPLHYPDTVSVSCRVSSVGRTSFQLHLEMRSAANGGAVAAESDNVIVMLDYEKQTKTLVSDELRKTMEELQR